MRKYSAALAIASFLISGIALPPSPHASDLLNRYAPKVNPEKTVKPDRMNGAMNMMGRMKGGCKQMMGPMMDGKGALKPNEQWQTKPFVPPKKDS
jgi:hypothetical protein